MSSSMHRFLAVTLLVVLLYGAYWATQRYWFGTYEYYQDNLEQVHNRLQRYNAMLATQPKLESELQAVRKNNAVESYYLDSATPTLAATRLQQQARQAIEGNGGNVVSTQILPVVSEDDFSKVAIRIQMTGDTEAVQKTLHILESARPLLFVDNVQVRARTIRQRVRQNRRELRQRGQRRQPPQIKTEVQLTTQFELAGYMRG